MSYQKFLNLMDKPGNIVHGSFIDNLESIMQNGISPPSMLPKDSKPKKFFRNNDKKNATCGTNMRYISTMLLGDENRYSFEKFKLWSPFFHYFIVANHEDWGEPDGFPETKKQGKPYFYWSNELALYNQIIPPKEFIGFVTYPNYLIKELSEETHGGEVFKKENGKLITTEEITNNIIKHMEIQEFKKPIYDINGENIL